MLKNTAMVIVSALLTAIALSAQPNKDTDKKETSAADKNPPVILAAPEHQNNGETNTAKPKNEPPTSHAPLEDPNWVLVIVGSVTCLVIGWQSWETRKSAKGGQKPLKPLC